MPWGKRKRVVHPDCICGRKFKARGFCTRCYAKWRNSSAFIRTYKKIDHDFKMTSLGLLIQQGMSLKES